MTVCPACKTEGPDGRFCSNCGALREAGSCSRCGTALAAGARFCHACGNPAASGPIAVPLMGRAQSSRIPWIIGGTAAAALLALVVAQSLNTESPPPPPAPAAPAASLSGAAASPARAPDISQMSPRERAARLFDRIMRLDEEGKRDSVQLFASMAIPTFQSLQPLDAHVRYDLGRVAAAAGQLDLAQSQADTILKAKPRHLLGLILAAITADRRGDTAAARRFRSRLLAAEPAERAQTLEEYQLHDADIRAAVAAARETR